MTTYFAAGGLENFTYSAVGVYEAAGGMGFACGRDSAGFARGYLSQPATSVWFHGVMNCYSPEWQDTFTFWNAAGVAQVKLQAMSRVWGLQYLKAGAWVQVGNTFAAEGTQAYDIEIVIHPTRGRIGAYVNGVPQATIANIDTSMLSPIAYFELRRARSGVQDTYWDSIIAASYRTIGHRVVRLTPAGQGTYNAWNGDYTAIDETAANDADLISSTASGQKESFTLTGVPASIDANHEVKGLTAGARILGDGSTKASALCRAGGVETLVPLRPLEAGLDGRQAVFDLNPATGAPWTLASLTGIELGLLSEDIPQ